MRFTLNHPMLIVLVGALILDVVLATSVAAQTSASAWPNCQVAQLTGSTPEGPEGGLGHFAHVYQVRNSSHRSCTLNGVPRLRLFDKQNREWRVPICANCQDYEFAPKPAALIKLRPGDSAHILFGIDVIEGAGHDCRRITRLHILGEGGASMTFHLDPASSNGVEICDKLSVSAWQSGPYK